MKAVAIVNQLYLDKILKSEKKKQWQDPFQHENSIFGSQCPFLIFKIGMTIPHLPIS